MKKLLKKILPYFAPLLACLFVRLLRATCRFKFEGFEEYSDKLEKRENIIHACWHGRLLFCPYSYWGKNGITALVSHHRDGDMVARYFKHFNISAVRGSTTRGSLGGVKGLLKTAKSGGDLALTPDGPKGPRHEAQLGTIHMAKRTGFPIYPITFSARKRWVLKSWDKFVVPKFFNTIIFICGDAIHVDKDASDEDIELKRKELEQSLIEITERADNYFN